MSDCRIAINLQEWETRHPKPGSELSGVFLEDDPRVQHFAQHVYKSGMIGVEELRNGLCLRAYSHVGRIRLGQIVITIRPKIENLRLLHLLVYAYGLRDLQRFSPTEFSIEDLTFQDLLIFQLSIEARELILRGLHKKYVPVAQDLSSPRGKINIQKIAQNCTPARTELPCIHYPRIEDCLINRVLLEGLFLGANLTDDPALKINLHRLTSILKESVSRVRLTRDLLKKLRRDMNRLNKAYGPSIAIIEMLLESKGISLDSDENMRIFPGFLFDMNKFFQDILYKFLRENLSGLMVQHEYSLRNTIDYLPEFNPQKRSAMVPRPDFVIFKGSELVSILDAKYRDLWEHPLPREMLYQVGIYAVSQGLNGTATILYPSSIPEAREARIGINVNDPVHGKGLAQVVLRPVDLNYLEKLVFASHKYDNCENERKSYANKLAFGY